MTPILEQFCTEARDFLEGISARLLELEDQPGNSALMGELFRLVHTLKGNSGLFDFPEMSRVLHAAEDLMVVVRDGELDFSQELADQLLEAMDFVSRLLDRIESGDSQLAAHSSESATLAQALHHLIPAAQAADAPTANSAAAVATPAASTAAHDRAACVQSLAGVPETLRMAWYRAACAEPTAETTGGPAADLLWLAYTPEPECFFKGEDPFYQARQLPGMLWQHVDSGEAWAPLDELDAYRCQLRFAFISNAPLAQLQEHFRYVPEQVSTVALPLQQLVLPVGDANGGAVYEDFVVAALALLGRGDLAGLERAVRSMLELSSSGLWLASALRWLLLLLECPGDQRPGLQAVIESLRSFAAPVWPQVVVAAPAPANPAAHAVLQAQLAVLGLPDQVQWLPGRLKACVSTLRGYFASLGQAALLPRLDAALEQALQEGRAAPLRDWLLQQTTAMAVAAAEATAPADAVAESTPVAPTPAASESEPQFGRRSEDAATGPKTIKVDQEKVDRLMNLIGEMVVAKNGLPYLAERAERVFGVRELAREIKTQYAVINRIAEEMQDAIMQVRMLPVSFVFQRFPRLVRDISRKLGKEVQLVLEGESTEADKNIIEALADPLIHIVRNSLDHGLELPEVRTAQGKPALGQLSLRASQEGGRVLIDIRDDGRGIDPAVIKRKAYEKGLIDEALLERISDQDAINLVFAAGFSTADVVSDLSGRGVGMDVVRNAVERVGGTVRLESQVGQGTLLRLSLPLSMAVTNVMIVESGGQIFGVPMDLVVETVRVPRASIRRIKSHEVAVLRGRIVPLRSLNELLATGAPQASNADDELATLVIRVQGEALGVVVDDFRGVVDIILKPMGGILGGLPGYTGSALLGDGSVLMVLNPKELI